MKTAGVDRREDRIGGRSGGGTGCDFLSFFKRTGFIITSLILILGPFFTFFFLLYYSCFLNYSFFPKQKQDGFGVGRFV